MGFVTSTNMLLPIPSVGSEPGPQYAQDVNNCLTLVDQHDHSTGQGVQVTPAGMNVNSDLAINNNNLTLIRSARFLSQSAVLSGVSDLGCLYEVANDLYFNDGLGNNIRITQSGGIAGTPGSISNLVPPASASYSAGTGTFIFQSDTNTAANVDGGSFVLRNATANSFGLTLSPPAGMSFDTTITLPTLPVVQSFVTLDSTGAMDAPWTVDGSSIAIVANQVSVPNGGITKPKLAALGQQVSASCGGFFTASVTPVDITNLSVTITTTGRPVMLSLVPDGTGSESYTGGVGGGAPQIQYRLFLLRGVTTLANLRIAYDLNSPSSEIFVQPPGAFYIDVVGAGTYTYKMRAQDDIGVVMRAFNLVLVAYEL